MATSRYVDENGNIVLRPTLNTKPTVQLAPPTQTQPNQTVIIPEAKNVPSAADAAASRAAAEAAAATAAAKKAGKDQTAKENAATQGIINSLLGTLGGYASGRDTQIGNAQKALNDSLSGILSNYNSAVKDYNLTGVANEEDESSKSAANVQNRARERMSLLEQAASQGAGETDQLRAQIQAFNNFDANQLEVTRSFFDTQRSVNSQIAGANSQAESSRRSSWNQNQEAVGNAWNDYWKNYSDVWTNIQRTGAGNTNVDSDYSQGFTANYGGYDPVAEASKTAGLAYQNQQQDEAWYTNWDGKDNGRDTKVAATNKAAATTIKAPKAAEGATLREKW